MSSIEDVIINRNNTKAPKKGHPFLIFFILLIIVGVGCFAFFNFSYNTVEIVDYTEEFFEYLATNNSKVFLNDALYNEILDKVETKDYESKSSINLSTTMKNEELNEIDISKLIVNVNTTSKKEKQENFFDINVKYLDNAIINGKVLESKDNIYVTSEEIVNMYIGGDKKNFYPILSKVLNKEIDFNQIEKIKDLVENRIKYTDLDIPIYTKLIKDTIAPGKITKKDNVIIQKEDESITTVEYSLDLTQEETNEILKKLLENLKKDDELLSQFTNTNINITESESQVDLNSVGENNIQTTNETEQVLQEDAQKVGNVVEDNVQVIQNDNLNSNEITNNVESSSPISNIKLKNNNEITNEIVENSKEKDMSAEEAINLLKSAIMREEINITLENLKNAIQTLIDEADKIQGNGITFSIYVENEKIIKLSMRFINDSNIDIEFKEISEKENKLIITYLKSADDNTGFSIELYKNKNEAATDFDILFNNIENKKINKKIKLETTLEGTVLSNNINNSILITYIDNTGEFKTNLNSEINFETNNQIEELNNSNSFNLVTAEEVYKQNLIEQLKTTIDTVYQNKKEQIKLIDNNTSSSEISNGNSSNGANKIVATTSKDQARQVLVDKISQMMAEAQNNNQEFGLNKLNGLEIEGHKISTIINSNLAIITIDGYTFNIDSEFNLSDAQ